jgi:hypothetical protein
MWKKKNQKSFGIPEYIPRYPPDISLHSEALNHWNHNHLPQKKTPSPLQEHEQMGLHTAA